MSKLLNSARLKIISKTSKGWEVIAGNRVDEIDEDDGDDGDEDDEDEDLKRLGGNGRQDCGAEVKWLGFVKKVQFLKISAAY